MNSDAAVDPSLRDVMNLLEREIKLSFNCHAIGRIENFDATRCVAQVSFLYKRGYTDRLGNLTYQDYPVLNDVPVVSLNGGTSGLTLPIAVGDECLIMFNDRDINTWFATGQNGILESSRLHSIADGIALVGLHSLGHPLSNYDTTRAVLYNGTTLVGVGASLVKIANNQYTLGSLLQTLCTQIGNLVSQCAAINVPSFGSPPANAAQITQIGTQIQQTAQQLKGLLE